jgi:diacylglycerol O-acyltransferase
MPEQISTADRAALSAEQGPVSMAVGGLIVLEGGPNVSPEAIVRRLQTRLHLVPRFRQRIEEQALGLAGPVWVDDPDFDAAWHVRRTTLPAPGGDAELAAFVAQEMSRRLDRTRPLWEVHYVEGLQGGRIALLYKMHHAIADGLGAIAVGALLFDPTPEPMEVPPPPADEREEETGGLGAALKAVATAPLTRAQRMLVESTQRALDANPLTAAEAAKRGVGLARELAKARPQAPDTPLNRPISANRRFGLARVGLSPLKQAGKAAGGTVNDAVLAVVAGMLRRYLDVAGWEFRGQRPVALMPVSMRAPGDNGVGNAISTVFVDLPVEIDDPVERIRAISAETKALKESQAVQAGALIAGVAGAIPPVLASTVARAMSGARAFNLVVSNVPGPQQPFYLDGSRLLELYPIIPLNPARQGLSVGIISYDGRVFFGLLADRNLDPPLEVATDALGDALRELLATA